MRSFAFHGWCAAAMLAVAAEGLAADPVADVRPSRRPNVIVILADDAGYGDFSLTGNKNLSTPAIDSLARDGAVLRQFMVQPFCSATRAEFLTGRWYPRTGVRGVGAGEERMSADEKTIAQVFHDAAYATGCFGKWHNGTQWPYHPQARGFDSFYGFTEGHWAAYVDATMQRDGRFVRGQGYIADDLATQAIRFIEREHAAGKSFFCTIPFNTPHSPMSVTDADWERFRDRPIGLRGTRSDAEDLAFTRAALAMVENLDRNVGRVLAAVDALAVRDDTIVVFFSDNGPNSPRWNAGLQGGKGSTDEGGVRSVCCIRYPARIRAGTVVNEIAGAIDLLPTLAGLAGVAVGAVKPLDGLDLAPWLTTADAGDARGRDDEPRVIFARRGDEVSARTTDYRLDARGRLYDMRQDPGQTTDIAAAHADTVAGLERLVTDYRRSVIGGPPPRGREALPVGFPGAPLTELTAGEAVPRGGIGRSSPHPNSSFLTHWTSPDDAILWPVDVLTAGRYDVDLWCTVPAAAADATVEVSCGAATTTGTLGPAWDPPLETALDRVPRVEGAEKEFRPRRLGTITLASGPATLTLRATKVPAGVVADVRRLVLRPSTPVTQASPPMPPVPPALARLVPSRRGHGETHGAEISLKNRTLGISLTSEQPLTSEQWNAVASLDPRWLAFNDRSLTDADMDQLVAIDPEEIHLRIVPLTGAGAKRFGDMKRLVKLFTHHMKTPTPEAREALVTHPSLAEFRTAGAFCIDALESPRLTAVEFAEEALSIENIRTLAQRSSITHLILFAHNQLTVDGAFLAEVARIKSLESLRICMAVIAYEDGLSHLRELPRLTKLDLSEVDISTADLEKLRQALPQVTLRHQPMTAEYRAKCDELYAKRNALDAKRPQATAPPR